MKELTPNEEIELYCKERAKQDMEQITERAFSYVLYARDYDYYIELLNTFNCNYAPINQREYFKRLMSVECNGNTLTFNAD